MLWIGVVGNLAILTALGWPPAPSGVPGLMPAPRRSGPWDLACAPWEVVVVVGCLRLRREVGRRAGPAAGPIHPFVLFGWSLSVLALGMLSISGAAA